jgi:hypothetical protein
MNSTTSNLTAHKESLGQDTCTVSACVMGQPHFYPSANIVDYAILFVSPSE